MRMVLAIIFLLSATCLISQGSPKQCGKGEYLSVDGRCLHDQSGETHPAGDGCNTMTCMDPACHISVVTAMACLRPDDPAPVPPKWIFDLGGNITGGGTITARPGTALTVSGPIITALPSISPAIQEVLDKHRALIARIKSCHKRKWPVADPVCHGTALALAGWFVDEHPEYFGK